HTVDRRHRAGPVPTSGAVHKNRLVGGIVHDREELFDLRIRWRLLRRHADAEELHSSSLDDVPLIRRPVDLQIDDGLDAERREIAIVRSSRLRAAVIVVVDLPEVADVNPVECGVDRGFGWRRGLCDGRDGERKSSDRRSEDTYLFVLYTHA